MNTGSNRRLTPVTVYCLLIVFAGLVQSARSQPYEQVPVEVFAQLPDMQNVSISPGGSHLAWMGRSNGLPAVFTFDLQSGTVLHRWESIDEVEIDRTGLFNIGEGFDEFLVTDYRWLNDERILIKVQFPRPWSIYGIRFHLPEVRLLAANVDGSDSRILFNRGGERRANQFSDPFVSVAGDTYVLALFSRRGPEDVRLINHYTGSNTRVARHRDLSGDWRTCGWMGNSNGEVMLRRECGPDLASRVSWREDNDGRWQFLRDVNRIAEDVNHFDFIPVQLTADGSRLYVHSRHEGRQGLYRIDFEVPENLEAVYLHDRFDIASSFYHPLTGEPLGILYVNEFPRFVYFDPELEQLATEVAEVMPGEVTMPVSMSNDGQKIVFASYGDQEAAVYSIVDLSDGSFAVLSPSRPNLPAEQMGIRETFWYAARDGVQIEGVLTYPPGASEADGPFPMVVMPHGGPYEVRDDVTFHSLAQFVASRGYLVFQPNYRGSGGYGNEFIASGYLEWGAQMQTDISDGVRHLSEVTGLADATRMCTAGWSYGGYAAVQAIIEEPDLYQCAIGVNGIYDLMLILVDELFGPYGDYWNNALGHPVKDEDRLVATSPARNAERIRAPVLVVYGREDYTVPYVQGANMFDALQKTESAQNGEVVHRVLDIPTGDHSMNPESDRVRTYQAIEEFLAQYLGGGS